MRKNAITLLSLSLMLTACGGQQTKNEKEMDFVEFEVT